MIKKVIEKLTKLTDLQRALGAFVAEITFFVILFMIVTNVDELSVWIRGVALIACVLDLAVMFLLIITRER